jgi:hypothetical protein
MAADKAIGASYQDRARLRQKKVLFFEKESQKTFPPWRVPM